MTYSGRIRSLDGLRTIAIGLVLGHHFFSILQFRGKEWVYGVLLGGWVGVDLFFVLSGFLVTRVVLKNYSAENFLKVFYTRRALRILIPYYLFLFCSYVSLKVLGLNANVVAWPIFMTHMQTIWLAWTDVWAVHFVNPMWTLGWEEYFYLVVPWFFSWKGSKVIVPVAITGLVLCVLGRYEVSLQRPFSPVAYFVLRPDGLLWGMLLAAAWESPATKKILYQARSGFFATAAVLTSALFYFFWQSTELHTPEDSMNAFLYSAASIASLLWVVVVLTAKEKSLTQRLLANAPMVYIGKISYSIYLYHELVHFWGKQGEFYSVPNAIVMVLISVAIAALSWEFLERRLIAYGQRLTYRPPSDHPSDAQHSSRKNVRATG